MKTEMPQKYVPDEVWMKNLIESYRINQTKLEKLTAYAKALEEENLRLKSCANYREELVNLRKYAKGLEEENAELIHTMERINADGPRVFKENEELRKLLRMNKNIPTMLLRTKPLRSRINLLYHYVKILMHTLVEHGIVIPDPKFPQSHLLNGVNLEEVEKEMLEKYLELSEKPE